MFWFKPIFQEWEPLIFNEGKKPPIAEDLSIAADFASNSDCLIEILFLMA